MDTRVTRTYSGFFKSLTGSSPFPYQARLGEEQWPELIDVPTGLGKTASVVVAWLWKLIAEKKTPRRLVYCLPMRVLVEQTRDAAATWCDAAREQFDLAGQTSPTVHVLMGGDVDDAWQRHPERPAIIVGTQDMLLSRALNRGYGMNRYMWPIHYGLLNADCLWVFDETQLMGVGVETSAQFEGLRRTLGTVGRTHSIWMSATLGQSQLSTVDHQRPPEGWRTAALDGADRDHPVVRTRTGARKRLRQLDFRRTEKDQGHSADLAVRVAELHRARGGLTLVILNRVARAQELYRALRKRGLDSPVGLVHSRFRIADRRVQEQILTLGGDRIVVSTQAIEAGVDVSARTLVTELAPWPSMVQRIGRCNRYGEHEDAEVHWIDISEVGKSDLALPYQETDLDRARALLAGLDDAGPGRLSRADYAEVPVVRPVIRRRDILDLFDTTPDLSGDDIDISRYIRDEQDTDVQFFWREIAEGPDTETSRPVREELCSVSVRAANDFLSKLEKKRKAGGAAAAWIWDPLDRRWTRATRCRAGQIVLLASSAGGYESDCGWTGDGLGKGKVSEVAVQSESVPSESEASDADPDTAMHRWVRLGDHLRHVQNEAQILVEQLDLPGDQARAVVVASGWHDVGKVHAEFQRRLIEPVADQPELSPPDDGPWGKSNHRRRTKSKRPHFRHELASALAWLQTPSNDPAAWKNLVGYLIAAHHGKVRLSIRSLPGESKPPDPGRLYARGIWDGDVLSSVELPSGERVPETRLDLSLVRLGEGSWLERMLPLRDSEDLGPFRLGLLEAVVRIADGRASQKEERDEYA